MISVSPRSAIDSKSFEIILTYCVLWYRDRMEDPVEPDKPAPLKARRTPNFEFDVVLVLMVLWVIGAMVVAFHWML